MSSEQTVFIVDDDPAVRDALSWMIGSLQYPVETFDSAQAFLDVYDAEKAGCLVLDVRLPGMSGLQLQQKLNAENIDLPVIIITGHGDVPMAVRAMQAGAVNFFEKPFRDQEVLDCIQDALQQDARPRQNKESNKEVLENINTLTPREKEIMKLMVRGDSNKMIAASCGISVKTVEVHRARIIDKMQARSLPALVRAVLSVEGKY